MGSRHSRAFRSEPHKLNRRQTNLLKHCSGSNELWPKTVIFYEFTGVSPNSCQTISPSSRKPRPTNSFVLDMPAADFGMRKFGNFHFGIMHICISMFRSMLKFDSKRFVNVCLSASFVCGFIALSSSANRLNYSVAALNVTHSLFYVGVSTLDFICTVSHRVRRHCLFSSSTLPLRVVSQHEVCRVSVREEKLNKI